MNMATIRHGMQGVVYQVDQYLPQLCLITQHARHWFPVFYGDMDAAYPAFFTQQRQYIVDCAG
ncbi:hypothetical protein D3C71_1609520 [compost metagenome]